MDAVSSISSYEGVREQLAELSLKDGAGRLRLSCNGRGALAPPGWVGEVLQRLPRRRRCPRGGWGRALPNTTLGRTYAGLMRSSPRGSRIRRRRFGAMCARRWTPSAISRAVAP